MTARAVLKGGHGLPCMAERKPMGKNKISLVLDQNFKTLLKTYKADLGRDHTQALLDVSKMMLIAEIAIELLGDWSYFHYCHESL